jgi:hypothetical protein
MAMYELDGCGDGDEHVATANYPNTSVVLNCPFGSDFCSSQTDWIDPTSVSPNVLTAQIQMYVEARTDTEW